MGSPKALLPYRGEGFLDRLIGIFGRHCAEVVVVLGYAPETIRAGMRRSARVVVNPEWEEGQLTSLKCGLRAIESTVDAVLFTPVDYPGIDEGTVAAVTASMRSEDGFVVPRHQGKRGHPVLFGSTLIPEFLNETLSAREVVHRHVSKTRYIDVEDEGILRDIDDPDAYQALEQAVR
jgi:molybdenum cofactor cytidylyltransferase